MNIHAYFAADAKRSRDPTRTAGIRQRWRMAMQSRFHQLRTLVKAAVVSNDVLGLGRTSFQSIQFTHGGDQLQAWSRWFTEALSGVLVGRDGSWVSDQVRAAYYFGVHTAHKELHPALVENVDTKRLDVLVQLAAHELQGIADATSQAVARVVANGLVQRTKPTELYKQIIAQIDGIGLVRSRALVNVMVVKSFNEAKLDVYRAGGVERVGIAAESQPKKVRLRPGDSAGPLHVHDLQGPGSRISREKAPSASTIRRIEKVKEELEQLGEVNILTAGDDDVCQECEDLSDDGPYGIDEAEGLIPAHPNCRCSFVPTDDRRFAEVGDRRLIEDYNEDQPRDDHGRWTSGGESASSLYEAPTKTADQIIDESGAREAVQAAEAKIAAGTATSKLHTDADGKWSAERSALHDKILNSIFSAKAIEAATPRAGASPLMTMLGGRGGSGKSWLSDKGPVNARTAILLDSDKIKSMLPEYKGWNAAHLHEEATHILGRADAIATKLGVNVIHDATMKSEGQAAARVSQYLQSGYKVEGHYMYASPQVAAQRAIERFVRGGATGRYVPTSVILANTNNEKNFDAMKGVFSKWSIYSNNVTGQAPKLVANSG